MTTTRPRPTEQRPELSDEGDLVTDYAYVAGLVEQIDEGNLEDARRWQQEVPPGSLCDADARAIHAAIGRVLERDAPSVPAIPSEIRDNGGRAGRRLIALYQRVVSHTKGRNAGAFILGLPNRVREIQERHAREEGLALVDRVRSALTDRSAGAATFASLRDYLDNLEALTLRRPGRREELGIVTMDTVQAKPMAWLWPGRLIASGLNIVTGLMGQTKGLYMVDVAARITNASRWPDGTGRAEKGSVLWVGNEDDPATVLRPRLDAAGADVSKVHYVPGVRSANDPDNVRPLSIGQDLAKIDTALDQMPDCRLIVLDPISEFMDADENASQEIRAELMPLVRLAAKRGVAIVAVCHLSKKQGLSMLQRIAGGGAFGQIARAVLIFAEDPTSDDRDDLNRKRLMVVSKMSGGRKNVGQAYRLKLADGHAVPRLEWIPGEVTIDADDVGYRPTGGHDHQAKIGEAVDYLREMLAGGAVAQRQIQSAMEGAGFKRRQIDHAASTLGVEKRQTSDRLWVWSLPAGDAFEGFPEFQGMEPRD